MKHYEKLFEIAKKNKMYTNLKRLPEGDKREKRTKANAMTITVVRQIFKIEYSKLFIEDLLFSKSSFSFLGNKKFKNLMLSSAACPYLLILAKLILLNQGSSPRFNKLF